jgi:ABC-type sugar transport system substrate-binding protein
MALGAVDVAKAKGLIPKLVIFGNDGEKDALESIEAGELAGTQYTDVFQQGRFAAAAATVLATGGVPATAFTAQGHLLMPYVIATKENVGSIGPAQRW